MDKLLTLILVAVALGADAFSLALGLGMGNRSRRYIISTAGMVGIFHVLMPLIGVLIGNYLGALIGRLAAWMGGFILIILGLRMIGEGWPWRVTAFTLRDFREMLSPAAAKPASSWGGLLALSWSVSVDAFGAGIGLGATMKGLTAFVVVLGLVAAAMTACGLLLGQLLGHWAGKWAEIAGGLVLAGIGVRMFF
ncbi:MAG: Uncharacterized protein XD66_0978 [Thermacetogenium phaeum]|uniref:Manganese efflux pump MntP n=1 Tax=Thermacetogenium phaeum TaxID=85874 RepID=A0A101FFZ6_9THEO|nr:MAG: Uncharacterized protein XD66_0978 [Thermacetogenium phaeum]